MHLLRSRPGYMPIPTIREPSTADARAEGAKRIRHLLVIPAVAVISFALGVITAAAFLVSVGPSTDDSFLQPTKLDITIPIIRQSFKYNRTFSEDPQLNNNTDEAWDGIVPGISLCRSVWCSSVDGNDSGTRVSPIPCRRATGIHAVCRPSATLLGMSSLAILPQRSSFRLAPTSRLFSLPFHLPPPPPTRLTLPRHHC
jgi:hypothetical protein